MAQNPAEIAHGPMFIGFMFNVVLLGITFTQTYIYYTNFKRDALWIKLFVFVLLVADTANTIFDFIYLYHSLIQHFGEVEYLVKADWVFATDPAITGIVASLVQFFFAWRIFVLTRSIPLCVAVSAGSLLGGLGAIVTAWEVGQTPDFTQFQNFKAVVIIWLASESVTDLIITSVLVWHLHKTGFPVSDQIVDRIIRLTVQTGLITSLVATLDMITFLTSTSGIHLIFNFPLCKLYTNSLMSSLNSRGGWKYGTKNNHTDVSGRGGTSASGGAMGIINAAHVAGDAQSRSNESFRAAQNGMETTCTTASGTLADNGMWEKEQSSDTLTMGGPGKREGGARKESKDHGRKRRAEVYVHVDSVHHRDDEERPMTALDQEATKLEL